MKEKKKEYVREMSLPELCDLLGGEANLKNSSCKFLDEDKNFDKSISEHPKYAIYYAVQMFVGTSLSFFGVYFSPTLVPTFWYMNVVFLLFASGAFLFSDWYQEGDLWESFKRYFILIIIYITVSVLVHTLIVFGDPLHLDYWLPMNYLTSDPVIATIMALLASSLLNVFLLPKAEVVQILRSA